MPTTTGKATDFITFSRASLATVTDSDGKIKWAGHNLLPNSESFDASAWDKSTSGTTAPSVTANNAVAPNGTTTADKIDFGEIDAAGDYSVCSQFSTLSEANYTGTVYIKAASSGDVGKKIWLYMYDTDFRGRVSITLTSNWQTFTTSANLTGGSGRQFAIATLGSNFGGENQGAVSVYVWGAHLYRSDLGGMVANTSAYPMYNPTTPKNLLGFTEDFSNVAWVKTNASVTANAITAPNGLQGADAIYDSSATGVHYIRQDSIAVTSGTSYVFSVYAKANGRGFIALLDPGASGGSKGRYFSIPSDGSGSALGILDGTPTASSITHLGDGWYRCSITVSAGGSTMSPRIYISDTGSNISYAGDITKGIYLWGAQLSDSASLDPYVANAFAAPTAAAYHGPRLDFDPVTQAARGLLVEEQRANLLTYSSQFDDATWVKTNLNTTGTPAWLNTAIAPDGTLTADKLIESTASGYHTVHKIITGGTYCFSIYAKAAERSFVQIAGTTTTNDYVTFNLSNGTVAQTGSGATGATIISVGNGWYRCSAYLPMSSASAYIAVCLNGSSGWLPSYIGDGTSGLHIWGAQLEAGSFATSYIPTTTASVTRSADVASVPTSAFPYSSTECTLGIKFIPMNTALPAIALSLSDAGTTNRISVNAFGTASVNNAGVVTAASTGSVTTGQSCKIYVALANNDFAASLNGAAVSTDNSVSVPTATTLWIGNLGGGVQMSGYIQNVVYIPRRLTNTELQSRSA